MRGPSTRFISSFGCLMREPTTSTISTISIYITFLS